MHIDPASHVPVFEQIVAHFRQAIAAGVYQAGEMLPSVRAAALRCAVNPNTVQRAYQALEREGLIATRRGRGVFVTQGGVAAAERNAAEAAAARFAEGVQIGRAAGIEDERLAALFERALGDER
ncbi:MAG TPA: GntR family transcriptional regulator [Phycisphaerae bacterium]|nr:GntR family transcriptional regulator [Phycisphaerales bacterium]HRX86133.1 GntR family transcriptional regulator [Phycisphaerae bacterium]